MTTITKDSIQKGRCSCGKFGYEAKGIPTRVAACHCKECQKRTGSAFGIGCYFPKQNIKLITTTSKAYTRIEQGRKLDFQFCSHCGTTVTWTLDLFPNLIAIAGGTFDNTNWIKPEFHVWTQSSQHWLPMPDDVPLLQQGSAGSSVE